MSRCQLTIQHDNISPLDALGSQHTGKNFNLVEQPAVRVCLLGLGHGAVVIDGDIITSTGLHVPINTVVACRYLAAGEPLPRIVGYASILQSSSCVTQGLGRLFMPVQVFGLASPEFLWLV